MGISLITPRLLLIPLNEFWVKTWIMFWFAPTCIFLYFTPFECILKTWITTLICFYLYLSPFFFFSTFFWPSLSGFWVKTWITVFICFRKIYLFTCLLWMKFYMKAWICPHLLYFFHSFEWDLSEDIIYFPLLASFGICEDICSRSFLCEY